MLSAVSGCPRSASSTALARSGTEPMLVNPTRTSSQMSPVCLRTALTATIAQSSLRQVDLRQALVLFDPRLEVVAEQVCGRDRALATRPLDGDRALRDQQHRAQV